MGAIWSLKVGALGLVESKYPIDPLFVTVFREADRDKRRARYSICVSTLLRRLEILGVDFGYARRAFERSLSEIRRDRELPSLSTFRNYISTDKIDTGFILSFLTFERWFKAVQQIVRGRTEKYDSARGVTPRQALVNYILDDYLWDDEDILHGFPGANWYALIRAVAQAARPDDEYELEYGELIHAEYYRLRTKLVDTALTGLASEFVDTGSTVILTEGAFDRRVLEGSLRVVLPDLCGFFSFMNFEGMDVPGGAGHLINQTKAFAGAGIKNRVIAVFDNDSAGRAALRTLKKSRLPSNFAAIHLPNIALAGNYPTIGPTGRRRVNINGRAASIELYLGRDVLRDKNGRLRTIQ
jgi:hypothetical protein